MDKTLKEKIKEAKKHLAKQCEVNAWWSIASLEKDVALHINRLKDKIDTGIRKTLWCDESIIQLHKEIDEIFGEFE